MLTIGTIMVNSQNIYVAYFEVVQLTELYCNLSKL